MIKKKKKSVCESVRVCESVWKYANAFVRVDARKYV